MTVMVTARHAGGSVVSGAVPAVKEGRWLKGSVWSTKVKQGVPSGGRDQRKRHATAMRSSSGSPFPMASLIKEATRSKSV